MVTPRLTPSEAKALANALTSYANDINEAEGGITNLLKARTLCVVIFNFQTSIIEM